MSAKETAEKQQNEFVPELVTQIKQLLELRKKEQSSGLELTKSGTLPPPEERLAVAQILEDKRVNVLRLLETPEGKEKVTAEPSFVKIFIILEESPLRQFASCHNFLKDLLTKWQTQPSLLHRLLDLESETGLTISFFSLRVNTAGLYFDHPKKTTLFSLGLKEEVGKIAALVKEQTERGSVVLPILAAASGFILDHKDCFAPLFPFLTLNTQNREINLLNSHFETN